MPKKKSRSKKSPAKKPARRVSTEPVKVSTGRGPSALEVGTDLVAMFNQGLMQQVDDKWHSPKILSIEGAGVSMGWSGRKGVRAKGDQWMANHTIHGASAEGPFVGASGFAVRFRMDVETKDTGKREMMEEIGVYTVQNGKIVREEFMYSRM